MKLKYSSALLDLHRLVFLRPLFLRSWFDVNSNFIVSLSLYFRSFLDSAYSVQIRKAQFSLNKKYLSKWRRELKERTRKFVRLIILPFFPFFISLFIYAFIDESGLYRLRWNIWVKTKLFYYVWLTGHAVHKLFSHYLLMNFAVLFNVHLLEVNRKFRGSEWEPDGQQVPIR